MLKPCFWMIPVLLLLSHAPSSASEKIAVAAFEYPPVYQEAKDKGLSGDIVVAAFKAAGIEADLKFYPVARMIRNVADGNEVCGIGGAVLFEAPDIAPKVRVASVIQYVSQGFLYDSRKYPRGIDYATLQDMQHYRIGVLFSSGIMKYLEKAGLKLDPSASHKAAARQLNAGMINAWAIVDLTGLMHMKELFPAEARFYRNTRPFNRGDVSLVCSTKRDPDNAYAKRFEEGLSRIKKNGSYMRLMAKYYGGAAQINREALTDDMR